MYTRLAQRIIRMEEKKSKYLAFISYRHQNKVRAKALQKALENYHLPVWVRDERPDLPETVRPVFRDETDLPAGGILDERIKEALRSSKKLIVIATPDIVHSNWPNQEIEYFAGLDVSGDNPLGRINDIIPVIYDGTPFSEDHAQECYPEALRRIIREKKDIYGIDVKVLGWERALSKIVAALLDVDPDTLWQRYRKAHRKKVLKEILIEAVVGTLLVGLAWEGIRTGFQLRAKKNLQVAETASALTEQGDAFLSRRLLLEAVPKGKWWNLSGEPELAWSLYRSMSATEGLIHVPEPISETTLTDSSTLVTLSVSSALRTAYLREWDFRTGNPVRADEYVFSHGSKRDVSFLFSPDRKRILTDDGVILEAASFSPVLEVKCVNSGLSCMAFSPDGSLIAGSEWRRLKVWDARTGEQLDIPNISFHNDWLLFSPDTIVFSPDGRFLAASPLKEGVGILDIDGMRLVSIIPAGDSVRVRSTGEVPRKRIFAAEQALSFSDDSRLLRTKDKDGAIHQWVISTGKLLSESNDTAFLNQKARQVYELVDDYTVRIHLPGKDISPVMLHPRVEKVLEISDWEGIEAVLEKDKSIVTEAISPDGRIKASADYDTRALIISDALTGKTLSVADTLDTVGILEFSPDGKMILSFGMDEDIILYDSRTGKLYSRWFHWEGAAPVFSPKGRLLASYNYNNNIFVWDYKGDEVAQASFDKFGRTEELCFSPDGKSLAIITDNGKCVLWEFSSGITVPLSGIEADIRGVCFSPDGKTVSTLTNDGFLDLWSASGGNQLHRVKIPSDRLTHIWFSEDGASIFAVSRDEETWRWDLPDFKTLAKDLWGDYGPFRLTGEEKRKILP